GRGRATGQRHRRADLHRARDFVVDVGRTVRRVDLVRAGRATARRRATTGAPARRRVVLLVAAAGGDDERESDEYHECACASTSIHGLPPCIGGDGTASSRGVGGTSPGSTIGAV